MFVTDPNDSRRREVADQSLSILVDCKKGPLNTVILADEKQIGKSEVLEILIKAPKVEIGKNSFAPAEIKVEKVKTVRKIYLTMLKVLDVVDYKEIPFKETVGGLVIVITFKVIVLK